MCLAAIGQLGLTGFQMKEQLRAGKAAEKSYQDMAAEERAQAAYEGVMATEAIGEELKVSQAEEAAIKASATSKGLRVGGSVGTMLNQAKGRYRARRRKIGLQTSESMRRRGVRAKGYRKAGRETRKTAWMEALGTGLGGFYAVGSKYPKRKPLFGD